MSKDTLHNVSAWTKLMDDISRTNDEYPLGTQFSAVDWLANKLTTIDWEDPYYREILSKAKEMEQR